MRKKAFLFSGNLFMLLLAFFHTFSLFRRRRPCTSVDASSRTTTSTLGFEMTISALVAPSLGVRQTPVGFRTSTPSVRAPPPRLPARPTRAGAPTRAPDIFAQESLVNHWGHTWGHIWGHTWGHALRKVGARFRDHLLALVSSTPVGRGAVPLQ